MNLAAPFLCCAQDFKQTLEDRSAPSKKGKKLGTSGGGGGAFRAFLHCVLAGTKFNKENLKAAARQYRQLSDEEMAYYRNLGTGATVAWQHGFNSFGERIRERKPISHPESIESSHSHQLVLQSSANSALIPMVARNLEDDLKEIRAKLRKHNLRQKEMILDGDVKIKQYQGSLVQEAPSTFDTDKLFEVAHAHDFQESSEAGQHAMRESLGHIRWFPPATQLAEVACFYL